MAQPYTVLCLASYFKGGSFLEECKRLDYHVILITEQKLENEEWPRDAIDEFYMMPDVAKQPDITYAVAYLARTHRIDAIIPLDDYDVETAAALREHLRLPGMGATQARYFRDKLAMRTQAAAHGIRVPDFIHVLNYQSLHGFMARVPPPWVLKPRSEAGSMGIKKLHSSDELWARLEELGDLQSYFVLERFVPGDVYHVDSIIWEGEVVFAAAHKYGLPPMTVYQGGGVFATSTLPYGGEEERALQAINHDVLAALGMTSGVTHAEYIRDPESGQFHFLEIAARVGGAGTDKLIECATGVNPWQEWARLELCRLRGEAYEVPAARHDYAGLLVSLARQEWPDTSTYDAPELVWRMKRKHHVGMILASPDRTRVQELLAAYTSRIATDFTAVEAPLEKPPN